MYLSILVLNFVHIKTYLTLLAVKIIQHSSTYVGIEIKVLVFFLNEFTHKREHTCVTYFLTYAGHCNVNFVKL